MKYHLFPDAATAVREDLIDKIDAITINKVDSMFRVELKFLGIATIKLVAFKCIEHCLLYRDMLISDIRATDEQWGDIVAKNGIEKIVTLTFDQ